MILLNASFAFSVFANTDLDSLHICKDSFEQGKKEGLEFFEEDAEGSLRDNKEYTSDPYYINLATEWYRQDKIDKFLIYAISYGSIFFIPASIHYAYSLRYLENASWMQSFHTVSRTLFKTYILGQILYKPTADFLDSVRYGVERVFRSLFSAGQNSLFPTWIPEIEIKAAEFKYKSLKNSLPKGHQRVIEHLFETLTEQEEESHSLNRIQVLETLKKIESIQSLPRQMMRVQVDENRLSELIKNYPPDVQKKLINYAESISFLSTIDSASQYLPFREILYLQGPPGTGKTHFLENFADVFYEESADHKRRYGLPVIRISLESLSSLEDLIGNPHNGDKLSKLAIAFSILPKDKNYKNPIILLDEADKYFNKRSGTEVSSYFLKTLFNNLSQKIHVYGFEGLPIDISNANFILAANAPVYDVSNAFMDRMTVVQFSCFEEQKRLSIACHKLGQFLSKTQHLESSDVDFDQIVEAVHKDQEQNPGIRTLLKTIAEYVSHLNHPKRRLEPFPMLSRLEKNTQIYRDVYSTYEMLFQKFMRKRKDLSVSLRQQIEARLQTIVKSKKFHDALLQENKHERRQVENYLENIALLMNFPYKVKDLKPQKDEIEKQLHSLLKPYPQHVQTHIFDAVRKHIFSSSDSDGKHYMKKHILYLYGPPGTGKSYLAQGIAKIMGLNVIDFDFKGATFDEIFGKDSFDFMDSKPPSRIAQRLTQKIEGEPLEQNSILFINEIDKILNYPGPDVKHLQSYLLDLLDRDKKEIEMKGLQVKIDVSRFLYILVGNESLNTQDLGSSLADRMTTIRVDGYDRAGKNHILFENFEKIMKSYELEVTDQHREILQDAVAYSDTKQQTSLRPLLDILESLVLWIQEPMGDFDFKKSLDLYEDSAKYETLDEDYWKEAASKYYNIEIEYQ
jgi:ATP-dependent Lon protease